MSHNKIEKRMKRMVLERDNYVCQVDGSKEKLEVHHIKPKGKKGKDFIENLITLCKKCHWKAHNTLSYGIWISYFRRLILLKKSQKDLNFYINNCRNTTIPTILIKVSLSTKVSNDKN